MKIENESQRIEVSVDSVTIETKKQDNHTIDELEQKIINYLYDLGYYESSDIELFKVIFNYEKKD